MKNKTLGVLNKNKKLPNGDIEFELTTSRIQQKVLYQLALKEKNITLKDLKYQAEYRPKDSFENLMIGALIYHATKEAIKRKNKNTKSTHNSRRKTIKKSSGRGRTKSKSTGRNLQKKTSKG